MNKEEALKIFQEVKENHKKLDSCSGHDFAEDVYPERKWGKRFRCTKCSGEVDYATKIWYEKGREHAKSCDINALVKVKLTAYGKKLMEQHFAEIKKQFPKLDFELKIDEEGYYKAQLWTIMKDLGRYCTPGGEPPFENMIIGDD